MNTLSWWISYIQQIYTYFTGVCFFLHWFLISPWIIGSFFSGWKLLFMVWKRKRAVFPSAWMYVVLPLYFRVRNGKLTFYSVTDKSYREREIKSVLHVCVGGCVYVCLPRQTSTLGQYVIDWAAGRGLLSPAMVQAGESSVSYVLALIGNPPWWRPTGAKAELQ